LYDIVVCDRTCLDTLVYGLAYEIALPGEYFSLALNHLNTFDHIFFIRPNSYKDSIINDNFRDTNVEMRNTVDKEFERVLKLWGGHYTEIKAKDVVQFDYIKAIYKND